MFFFRLASSLLSSSVILIGSRSLRAFDLLMPLGFECLRACPLRESEVVGLSCDDCLRSMGDGLDALVEAVPTEVKLAWLLANISDPSCGKRGIVKSLKSRVESRAPSIIGDVSRLLVSMNGDSKYAEPGVLSGGKAVEDGADKAMEWFTSS